MKYVLVDNYDNIVTRAELGSDVGHSGAKTYFKGVKSNIEKFYQNRLAKLDLKSSEDKILESFENYLRVKFLEFKNQSQIDKKLKFLAQLAQHTIFQK